MFFKLLCKDTSLNCCLCRDRAEERRKGFNPDYERVNADLASIVTGNSLLEQDIGKISVEDSKFLGGDVDHTHLVKGLDYALLQKVPIDLHLSTEMLQPAIKPLLKSSHQGDCCGGGPQ